MNNFSSEEIPQKMVICDFDGTIVEQDVCDKIMEEFSDIDWRPIGEDYENGMLSHRQMNIEFVDSIKVSPEELGNFLIERIKIRKGFHDFLNRCQSDGVLTVIVSGGWDYYISKILQDIDIEFVHSLDEVLAMVRSKIAVICNSILFDSKTNQWTIRFPWGGQSRNSTPDKAKFLQECRSRGVGYITVIGDGTTDKEMAKLADVVYARNGLLNFCRSENIQAQPFTSFDQVQSGQ